MRDEKILVGIDQCEQLVVELLNLIPDHSRYDTARNKVTDSLSKIRLLREKVSDPSSELDDLLKLVDEADALLRSLFSSGELLASSSRWPSDY